MVLIVWVEGEGWFQPADSSVFANLTARLDSAKWKGTIVLDVFFFPTRWGVGKVWPISLACLIWPW